ncbi:MAG: cytochrome c nitrite reductase small subunit [Bacteroidales bacterium]
MKKLLNLIPGWFVVPLFIIGGIAVGLTGYIIYVSRAHTYLSDDPAACVNCHIMAPYYQSWMHSSHGKETTCNDCHVPQDNVFNKYAFKAMDGLYHSAVFTLRGEPDVIRPRDASSQVIMDNCIRCHTQLNTEFVNTGMIDYTQTTEGEGKKCWDCHRDVPHTVVSNISSTPNAIVPMPESPVPAWLKKMMNNKKSK